MLYFDTNALLPYYREEQASVCVQQRLCAQSQPVLISYLTEVEVASLVGWALRNLPNWSSDYRAMPVSLLRELG